MRAAVLAVLLVLCALPVSAQVAMTGTSGVSFSDTDHTALNTDGTSVIARYELRFIPGAGCAPVALVNLGKPNPDAQGLISVKPIPAFGAVQPNCIYTAVLAAVGPTGAEGVSAPSVPFWRPVPKTPASPSQPGLQP